MKKLCWFLIIVLLLGCFVGCQQAPGEGSALTNSQKNKIENDWRNAHSGEFPGWYDKENGIPYGMVYYGTENGYIILMYDTGNSYGVDSVITIAGYEFLYVDIFSLYAYKNSEFYNLQDAYASGDISQAGLASIFEAHKAHVCVDIPERAKQWGYCN